jgi:hypothetical protein
MTLAAIAWQVIWESPHAWVLSAAAAALCGLCAGVWLERRQTQALMGEIQTLKRQTEQQTVELTQARKLSGDGGRLERFVILL